MLIDKIARNAAGQVLTLEPTRKRIRAMRILKIFMRRALYEEADPPALKKLSSGTGRKKQVKAISLQRKGRE